MKKQFIAALLLSSLASLAFAEGDVGSEPGGDTEARFLSAIQTGGDSVAIYRKWVNSSDPAKLALAEKYLRKRVHTGGGLPQPENLVAYILERKSAQLYPAALHWCRENPEGAKHVAPLEVAILAAIPTNEGLRTRLQQSPPQENGFELVKRPSEAKPKQPVTLMITSEFDLRAAAALAANKELRDVETVSYEGTVFKLKEKGQLAAEQLAPESLADWILDNKQSELYPYLMKLRSRLTANSVPSRSALTAKIVKEMAIGQPGNPEKLALAVADNLITDSPDDFSAGRKKRTLDIDLQDGSDLALARALRDKTLKTDKKGEPKGLQDVQVVRYNNSPKPKDGPTIPDINYVYDVEGKRIGDILSADNFETASLPKTLELEDRPVRRKPKLRTDSVYHFPKQAVYGEGACPFPRLSPAAPAAKTK